MIEEEWAAILEEIEEYCRASKLRKAIWGKITPHLVKYLAWQTLLNLVKIAADQTSDEHSPLSLDDAAEDADQDFDSERSVYEMQTECDELNRKLREFWATIPPLLREKTRNTVAAAVLRRTQAIKERECFDENSEQDDYSPIPTIPEVCIPMPELNSDQKIIYDITTQYEKTLLEQNNQQVASAADVIRAINFTTAHLCAKETSEN